MKTPNVNDGAEGRSYSNAGLDADKRDAERYRWLRNRMLGADFNWNESGVTVLVFEFPGNVGIGANCDKNIDAGMLANVKLRGGFSPCPG